MLDNLLTIIPGSLMALSLLIMIFSVQLFPPILDMGMLYIGSLLQDYIGNSTVSLSYFFSGGERSPAELFIFCILLVGGMGMARKNNLNKGKRSKNSRKEREEELEGYRLLYETANDAILIMQGDKFVDCNKKALEFFQVKPEEIIGKNPVDFSPPQQPDGSQSREKAWEYIESALTGKPQLFEWQHKKKDGTRVDCEINLNTFELKGKLYIQAIVRDITHRKTIEKELRRSKEKIEKLHRVALAMSKCQIEEEVFHLTVSAAEEILEFSLCSLDMVEGDYLVVKATSSGLPAEGTRSLKIDEGIAGRTLLTGKPYLIDDIRKDQQARPASGEYRSAISLPIGKMGVFQVAAKRVGAFHEEDLALLELLISHTTEVLKRIKSQEKVNYMTFYDPLTGLYNRVRMDEEIAEIDHEDNLPMSVIMGDMNSLKLVNDVFGHAEGDRMLRNAGQVISKICRKKDILGRWGGDEFLIILPQTTSQEAREVVAGIKKEIKNFGDPVPLGISLGLGFRENMNRKMADVISEAEDLMYREKLLESREHRQRIVDFIHENLSNRSNESQEHFKNLHYLVQRIGRVLALSETEMEALEMLPFLHDLGKIAIPEEILKKPGPLKEREWEVMKRHPEIGYRIAASVPELGMIAEGILSHHERWDGSGYPLGIEGENIVLIARIFAIADAFEVMTAGRPWQEAISRQEAIERIRAGAGSQFDPWLVKMFEKAITTY